MINLIRTRTKIYLWDGKKITRNYYDNGKIEKIEEPTTEQEILDELEKVNFGNEISNQIKQINKIAIN